MDLIKNEIIIKERLYRVKICSMGFNYCIVAASVWNKLDCYYFCKDEGFVKNKTPTLFHSVTNIIICFNEWYEKNHPSQVFWMIIKQTSGSTSRRHPTLESARAELERLITANPNEKFFLLKTVEVAELVYKKADSKRNLLIDEIKKHFSGQPLVSHAEKYISHELDKLKDVETKEVVVKSLA